MAVDDIYYVTVNHTLGLGQKIQWGVHYRESLSVGAENGAEMLAEGLTALLLTGDYLEFLMDSAILDTVEAVQVVGGGNFFVNVLNELGLMTGQQLPPQCSPLISFYTTSIGRDQHSRIYLPPPNETANDAGALENGYQGSLQTFGEALASISGSTAGEFNQVVFHRESETSDDIAFAVVREDFKTQRRRVVGVGI